MKAWKTRGPAAKSLIFRPRFARSGTSSVVTIAGTPGTTYYGTGEQVGPLARNGRRCVLWNTDAYDYTDRTLSLYQAHPFILAVRPDGTSYGIIVESTWRTEIALTHDVHIRVDGPSPAVTIFEAPHPREIIKTLATLTGTMPLPPRWALGYHQCRYSYETASRALEVAQTFRERQIPCDVLWLDIDYMDEYRCFTFSPERFPNPTALNKELHALGMKTVWMIDPGLQVNPDYSTYVIGHSADHFVKTNKGNEYNGPVWPGPCAFPDFTRARTRDWWGSLFPSFLATGIDGVWNDMNEPAIFATPTKTMPQDNLHDADPELGGPGNHARYHNIYGMQMVRATRDGIIAARPDRRPFVLTRANFLGGHRYAATWTGDNHSDWNHLKWSIATSLNLGLSGQPMSGPDIGGFAGDAHPELFDRFMAICALLPFARGHTNKGTKDHEPWSFGPEVEASCKASLQRRVRLIHHLYTLAWRAARTGEPMMQPLFFADPTSKSLRNAAASFLLGPNLLVRASLDPSGGGCPDPLPPGDWARIHLVGEEGMALPELLLRRGSGLVLAPVAESAQKAATLPVTILAALDREGRAEVEMYDDAGDGPASGETAWLLRRWTISGAACTESVSGPGGIASRPSPVVELIPFGK